MSTLDTHIADSSFVDTTPRPEGRVDKLLNHYANELTHSVNEIRFSQTKFQIENVAWATKRTLRTLVGLHRFIQKELVEEHIYNLRNDTTQRTIAVLQEIERELNKIVEFKHSLGCSISGTVLRLRLFTVLTMVNECLGYINGGDDVNVSIYMKTNNSFIRISRTH